MIYTIGKSVIHIQDSYLTRKRLGMEVFLQNIPNGVNEAKDIRGVENLVKEWRAHNFLYDLGLFRSHTKDVDLDATGNGPKYQWLWNILSALYIE